MNKEKVLHIVSLIAKYASLATGGAAYMNYIPEKWTPIAILGFAIASILKDTVNRVGDLLDDGKANSSFKP